MREITNLGHAFPKRIVLVMKSRRYRNFIRKTDLQIHVCGQKYYPQTIGREERFHGSLKLEWLYRYLPKNRQHWSSGSPNTEVFPTVNAYMKAWINGRRRPCI